MSTRVADRAVILYEERKNFRRVHDTPIIFSKCRKLCISALNRRIIEDFPGLRVRIPARVRTRIRGRLAPKLWPGKFCPERVSKKKTIFVIISGGPPGDHPVARQASPHLTRTLISGLGYSLESGPKHPTL